MIELHNTITELIRSKAKDDFIVIVEHDYRFLFDESLSLMISQ